MNRVSPKQAEALACVAAGRLTWGDLYPARTARLVARWEREQPTTRDLHGEERPATRPQPQLVWMLDGAELYGAEHGTFRSLEERGWIEYDAPDGATPAVVRLTEAGRVALVRHREGERITDDINADPDEAAALRRSRRQARDGMRGTRP